MLFLLIAACGAALLALLIVVVAIFVFAQANQRDMISPAREGWIQRRSQKDEQNW